MKKFKLLGLILCLFFASTVNAASATTSMSGTKTINVGKSTTIYVKLNASDKIEGADITFETSSNLTVTKVAVGKNLTQVGKDGNRYLLYANTPVASGSTLLAITVKGKTAGTGKVTVTKLDATVSGETVHSNSKTYNITIKKVNTTNPTEPDEPTISEENDPQAVSNATILVEAAEKSLLQDDYNDALNAVNSLKDSTEKTALLARLSVVKNKIDANKPVNNNDKCPTCPECEESDNRPWIIISIILLICTIGEGIILLFNSSKKEN